MSGNSDIRMAAILRRAAERGCLAPSVHNTQPWLFRLGDDCLEIHADRMRQLQVLDPRRRQLTISCGCALFNVRVSVAADGRFAAVKLFPDQAAPDYLALVSIRSIFSGTSDLAALDGAIEARHTNRRRFDPDSPLNAAMAALLTVAAEAEGASLTIIAAAADRRVVKELAMRADQAEMLDPAYRAELRAWTTTDPRRRDGVPAFAVPHTDAGSLDEIPIRDFDTAGAGWLPTETASSANQNLLLISTERDNDREWLAAGQATQRVLLELTRNGFVASPLNQLIERADTNSALRNQLKLSTYPQMLLRAGKADMTLTVPRRSMSDVVKHANRGRTT